ncbi:DUF4834 family protein [bacterium]|nr:DUF4834 family protein [bacterium]
MLKYLFLFVLILWILRRVMRVFTLVSHDQGGHGQGNSGPRYSSGSSSQSSREDRNIEGEYVDYEEVD